MSKKKKKKDKWIESEENSFLILSVLLPTYQFISLVFIVTVPLGTIQELVNFCKFYWATWLEEK